MAAVAGSTTSLCDIIFLGVAALRVPALSAAATVMMRAQDVHVTKALTGELGHIFANRRSRARGKKNTKERKTSERKESKNLRAFVYVKDMDGCEDSE